MRRQKYYRSSWDAGLDPPNKKRRSNYFDKFKDMNQIQSENGGELMERNAFSKQTKTGKNVFREHRQTRHREEQFTQDRLLPPEKNFNEEIQPSIFQRNETQQIESFGNNRARNNSYRSTNKKSTNRKNIPRNRKRSRDLSMPFENNFNEDIQTNNFQRKARSEQDFNNETRNFGAGQQTDTFDDNKSHFSFIETYQSTLRQTNNINFTSRKEFSYNNKTRSEGGDFNVGEHPEPFIHKLVKPKIENEIQNSTQNRITCWQPEIQQQLELQLQQPQYQPTIQAVDSWHSPSVTYNKNNGHNNRNERVESFIKTEPENDLSHERIVSPVSNFSARQPQSTPNNISNNFSNYEENHEENVAITHPPPLMTVTVPDDVKSLVKSRRRKSSKKRKRVPEKLLEPIVPSPIKEKKKKRKSISIEPEVIHLDDLDSVVLDRVQTQPSDTPIATSSNATQTEPEPEKKKRKSRKDKDVCELCDKKGHTAMQCQMICINCNEQFHNMKSCKQPSHTKKTLINFLDYCVKQFATDEIDVQNIT